MLERASPSPSPLWGEGWGEGQRVVVARALRGRSCALGLPAGRSTLRADYAAVLGMGWRRGTRYALLRSNNRGGSDVDARCARPPQASTPRRPTGRPTAQGLPRSWGPTFGGCLIRYVRPDKLAPRFVRQITLP